MTGQQVSFLWCASVPLLALKILVDFFKMDNLRPKLLISKQVIVNLGEEYLPSKFFSCLRLVRTLVIYLSIKRLFWPEQLMKFKLFLGGSAFYKTTKIYVDAKKIKR